jgi:hypothetical protein
MHSTKYILTSAIQSTVKKRSVMKFKKQFSSYIPKPHISMFLQMFSIKKIDSFVLKDLIYVNRLNSI